MVCVLHIFLRYRLMSTFIIPVGKALFCSYAWIIFTWTEFIGSDKCTMYNVWMSTGYVSRHKASSGYSKHPVIICQKDQTPTHTCAKTGPRAEVVASLIWSLHMNSLLASDLFRILIHVCCREQLVLSIRVHVFTWEQIYEFQIMIEIWWFDFLTIHMREKVITLTAVDSWSYQSNTDTGRAIVNTHN